MSWDNSANETRAFEFYLWVGRMFRSDLSVGGASEENIVK